MNAGAHYRAGVQSGDQNKDETLSVAYKESRRWVGLYESRLRTRLLIRSFRFAADPKRCASLRDCDETRAAVRR
jgi:hypothetical protein